ncbi:hypothetical protein GQ457_09G025580 [Hibiscus cannabinus]
MPPQHRRAQSRAHNARNFKTAQFHMHKLNTHQYLGVPLLHSRVNVASFKYLIQAVQSKLCGWKAKTLSLVKRITFAKAVLSAIPIYTMQTTVLPKKVCLDLERLFRRFIWGIFDDGVGVSLVRWDEISSTEEWLKLSQGNYISRRPQHPILIFDEIIFGKSKTPYHSYCQSFWLHNRRGVMFRGDRRVVRGGCRESKIRELHWQGLWAAFAHHGDVKDAFILAKLNSDGIKLSFVHGGIIFIEDEHLLGNDFFIKRAKILTISFIVPEDAFAKSVSSIDVGPQLQSKGNSDGGDSSALRESERVEGREEMEGVLAVHPIAGTSIPRGAAEKQYDDIFNLSCSWPTLISYITYL